MIWVETPTNPLLKLADLRAVAAVAKKRGIITRVRQHLRQPYLQRPLELGFDIVVHSTTKYLNGHSDVIGGVAVVGDDAETLREQLASCRTPSAASPGPFDSFLALRGIKTLALRMERHCANALAIAQWLETHPKVERVHLPGPRASAARAGERQMHGFGGIVTVARAAGCPAALPLRERASSSRSPRSLGGVESLIEHPAS